MSTSKKQLLRLFKNFIKQKNTPPENTLFWMWLWETDAREDIALLSQEEKDNIEQRLWSKVTARTYAKSSNNKMAHIRRVAAAAVLTGLILTSIVTILHYNNGQQPSIKWSYIKNNEKTIKQFYLPDSTRVILDVNSSLAYNNNYNTKNRLVSLEGQGSFQVHKNAECPFMVSTGDITTRALGTAFNVEYRQNQSEIRIALTEGKVAIAHKSDSARQVLLPGQIVHYNKFTHEMSTGNFNNNVYLWVSGGMSFQQTPLPDALETLTSKYGLVIKYDATQLIDKTVTASFDKTGWKKILENILFPHNLHYTVNNNIVNIY